MNDQHRLDRAMAQVTPEWNGVRADRILRGVRRQRAQRPVRHALAAAVVLIVGVAVLRWPSAPRNSHQLATADGSVAAALAPGTKQHVTVDRADLIEVELDAGSAEYRVTKHSERRYRVHAGNVTVEVLGTKFAVYRHENGTIVRVDEGRVRVLTANGETLLSAGAERFFDATPAVASTAPAPTASLPAPTVAPAVPAPHVVHEASTGNPVDALLLAADRARADGDSRAAAHALRRALASAPAGDARASLAAFTLGRVLLDELHEPVEAANAFARIHSLAPTGPLAEDAAAREVEAWAAAGDAARAAGAAQRYLELYPTGRRASEVRRLGQID